MKKIKIITAAISLCMAASLFVVIRTIYLAIKVEKRKK